MKLTESMLRKIIQEELQKEAKDFIPKSDLVDLGRGGGYETRKERPVPVSKEHWFPMWGGDGGRGGGYGEYITGYKEPSNWFRLYGKDTANTYANVALNSYSSYKMFKGNPASFIKRLEAKHGEKALQHPLNAEILEKIVEMTKAFVEQKLQDRNIRKRVSKPVSKIKPV